MNAVDWFTASDARPRGGVAAKDRGKDQSVIIELHILQNFAPSNLNRDDTGSPKDCEFGGHRRARISSQCLKRAIRTEFRRAGLIEPRYLAERTKRAAGEIARRLAERGRPADVAEQVAVTALGAAKLDVKPDGKTEYLLFLSDAEMNRIAEVCERNWEALIAATGEQRQQTARGRAQNNLPADIKTAVEAALDGGRAVDLALFGRMIADLPERNVEAACQVAHAISTNRVSMEFDFYTAVDDLKPEDTAGADMLGTVEFNSACFYRYACTDTKQLRDNLDGDASLADKAVGAFLRAAVTAEPTGKQNSMAAHNPPSLVMVVVRDRGQWNLANAFVKPVGPGRDGDLVQESVGALDTYWNKLVGMYGSEGLADVWVATTEPERLRSLAARHVRTVGEVIENALARVGGDQGSTR